MNLKIIPFEYCSLARASKFFNCEIDDFFHWYETNKISISLKLLDNHATALSIDNNSVEFKTEFLGSNHIEYDVMASANNRYSYIDDKSVFVGHRLSFDRLNSVYRVTGFAHDFWKPCDSVIQALRHGGRVTDSFSASPYAYDGDFRVMITVREGCQTSDPDSPALYFHPDFTLDDLILHKEDLNIINHLMAGIPYSASKPEIMPSSPLEENVEIDDFGSDVSLVWSEFASKETSLKFIAGMALALSKHSNKFRNGENTNKTSIAKEAITNIIAQGIEFNITERQLTSLISQALNEYAPKLKE